MKNVYSNLYAMRAIVCVAHERVSDDALICGHEPAYANWSRMSPSVRRTYARAYFDAKTEQTRARRLERILDRLHQNLKLM